MTAPVRVISVGRSDKRGIASLRGASIGSSDGAVSVRATEDAVSGAAAGTTAGSLAGTVAAYTVAVDAQQQPEVFHYVSP